MGQSHSKDKVESSDPLQSYPSFSKSDSKASLRSFGSSICSKILRPSESLLGSTPSDTTVSKLVEESLSKFDKVINSDSLVHREHEISSKAWRDELCRFYVWAHNVDHEDGQSSFDDRLSFVPHLKSQTVRLLEILQELLNDLEDIDADTGEDSPAEDCDEYGEGTESIHQYTEVQHIFKNLTENNKLPQSCIRSDPQNSKGYRCPRQPD